MKELINLFNEYVKKYNLRDKHLIGKYHHSFRVMEFCEEISLSINLNEEDVFLAKVCGLLHDIGRFNQYTNYQTFDDEKSLDHGDEAVRVLLESEIINKLNLDEENKTIILNSVKYHNKYKIDDKLDKRIKMFCNIVRDADKIDIIREQCNSIYQSEIIIKRELLDEIYNKKICSNEYIINEVDAIIRMLSWIFDINFKYTYNFLLKNKIIENKFNLLEIYGPTTTISELKDFVYKEIEKRC